MSATNVTNVIDAIGEAAARLSPAERRVADVVMRDPEAVAFGTVAEIAALARTSGPTVVRFAQRAGFEAFVGLQAAVRDDLSKRLRPAVERIRSASSAPALERTLEIELANVRRTLEAVTTERFTAVVRSLSDPKRRVFVLPSEQCRAPASGFADELSLLRDGVHLLGGSEFRVVTELLRVEARDVVVLVDLQRHERWLLAAAERVATIGAERVAVTDSPLSALSRGAAHAFAVSANAAGPFDSNVGVQVLLSAFVAGVADRRKKDVRRRLETLEAAWTQSGALSD